MEFATDVRTGKKLEALIRKACSLERRECFDDVKGYLYSPIVWKVFILYGLQDAGSRTLMKQVIASMTEEEMAVTAYIRIDEKTYFWDIRHDMYQLEKAGFRYIFIEGIAFYSDFIRQASLFSDIFASSGMKIFFSGPLSLSFSLAERDQLYDRTITYHTTFITFREASAALGFTGIDEFIRLGGTAKKATFSSAKKTTQYIECAVADNLEISLDYYEFADEFRFLRDMHDKFNLFYSVYLIVENLNDSLVLEVLRSPSCSGDPIAAEVAEEIRKYIEKNRKVMDEFGITEKTGKIIRDCLDELDLTFNIEVRALPYERKGERTVISQPGMRYAQAKNLVKRTLRRKTFSHLSTEEKTSLTDRIMARIGERIEEDVVLLETKLAYPKRQKNTVILHYSENGYNMVVYDKKDISCDVYRICRSNTVESSLHSSLTDERLSKETEHLYGPIMSRNVIYRGESVTADGIRYINVEEYLRALPAINRFTY